MLSRRAGFSAWGNPLEFLDETDPAKNRGYGENFMILTNRFCMVHPCHLVTDGQKDRQAGDST